MDWTAGLATRASTQRAARWGGIALLAAAAIGILMSLTMTLVSTSFAGKPLGRAIIWMIGASIPSLIIAIAGSRMMRGEGRMSGSIAVLLLVADMTMIAINARELSIPFLAMFTIRGTLLLGSINGLRGAFALRSGKMDHELEATFS